MIQLHNNKLPYLHKTVYVLQCNNTMMKNVFLVYFFEMHTNVTQINLTFKALE